MKNVCFFDSVSFWGGGEKLHLEYALEFKIRGYKVIIAAKKNSPLSREAKYFGIETIEVSVRNLSFLDPFKIIKLARLFRKNKIDSVIFSGSHDLKAGSIAAKLVGVGTIVYLRGLASPVKSNFVNRFIFNNVLTHIVANSLETKKMMLKNLGKSINENKIKIIYHGIEIDAPKLNENLKIDSVSENGYGIILGSAGRLTKQKGQLYLIEIARKLKEKNVKFTLFIAGTGELQSELESLIEQFHFQKEIILLGFVKDMDRFMNSIDIFLLTSIWEGFGYVLVESMIKSKPVVAFNMTSNPEIVTQNETGFLIDYPDIDMFVEKIQLLAQDEVLRKKLGENGKNCVINRFNISDRITEFEYYLLGKQFVSKA